MHTNLAINAMFNRAKKIERGEGCIRKYRIHSGLISEVGLTYIDKTDPLDQMRRDVFWENKLMAIQM